MPNRMIYKRLIYILLFHLDNIHFHYFLSIDIRKFMPYILSTNVGIPIKSQTYDLSDLLKNMVSDQEVREKGHLGE